MDKDEALKLALEALTIIRGQLKSWGLGDEAIAVCKQALAAQPAVQEPRQCELCGEDQPFTGTCGGGRDNQKALCYTPPAAQRQWVGLTDEDKLNIEMISGKSDVMLAEMVEAKLKERNV